MGAVSSTGREALDEMRRLLGVLREHTDTPLAPQPGLDQLDALVEQVRGAGLRTRLTRTGTPAPLSPGAQLAVYRLVQEALTNTLKHARGASAAEVHLHFGERVLSLEVVDDGAPAQPGPTGHGLAGMRERAAAYGAAVDAGPRRDGGWRVGARFPVTPMIRVLLADDQELLRTGFRMVLEAQDGIAVVGEAGDGDEAVVLTTRLDPDVVLMDVRMPGVDGIEATRRLVAAGARARVLILTTFDLDEYAFSGLRAGASGFLLKDVPPRAADRRDPRRRRG